MDRQNMVLPRARIAIANQAEGSSGIERLDLKTNLFVLGDLQSLMGVSSEQSSLLKALVANLDFPSGRRECGFRILTSTDWP